MEKKYFHGDDVIDDVTEWPQISFSISFINEKEYFSW